MAGQPTHSVFFVRRSRARVAYCDASLPDDLAKVLWRQPEALAAMGVPLRRGGARLTVRLDWDSKQYVLKHYIEPTWRHALQRTVRASRAWSTWNASRRLADAGIATPRPVACVENRWGHLRRDSFLMYPYVEGTTLRTCLACGAANPPQLIAALWRQLAELFQRLKELRASLSDTNAGNFIVSPSGRLWVIDLDKTRFHQLRYFANRHQHRAWKQLLRSAAKCYKQLNPLPLGEGWVNSPSF